MYHQDSRNGRIKIHSRTITVDKVLRFRLIKNRNISAPFLFPLPPKDIRSFGGIVYQVSSSQKPLIVADSLKV